MILKPIKNSAILNAYEITLDAFILFSSFVLFLGIFIKALFYIWSSALIKRYINESLSNYKNLLDLLNQFNLVSDLLNSFGAVENVNKISEQEQNKVESHNSYYNNLILGIIGGVIGGFLLLLIIPVVLGLIPLHMLNWKYIIISFIVNIALIFGFQCIFLFVILFLNNPINLSVFFTALGY